MEKAGSLVRQERKKKGWTQKLLARQIGVHQSDVARLEAGAYGQTGITFRKVAQALKIPESAFWDLVLLEKAQP